MAKSQSRTQRILSLFYYFHSCQEVELAELRHIYPAGDKTIQRDLRYLKEAGLMDWRYSQKTRAYYPRPPKEPQPKWPEKQTRRRHMERIVRICRLMTRMWDDDPLGWYRENYPELTDRTRQRDFNLLRELGWEIERLAAWETGDEVRWRVTEPDAFGLTLFNE